MRDPALVCKAENERGHQVPIAGFHTRTHTCVPHVHMNTRTHSTHIHQPKYTLNQLLARMWHSDSCTECEDWTSLLLEHTWSMFSRIGCVYTPRGKPSLAVCPGKDRPRKCTREKGKILSVLFCSTKAKKHKHANDKVMQVSLSIRVDTPSSFNFQHPFA